MKHLIFPALLCCLIFVGCKKNKPGNLRQKIHVTNQENSQRKSGNDLRHDHLGDFITTLTPSSFVGTLYAVRFVNDNLEAHLADMLTLVQADPANGIQPLLADFSQNATISVVPVLNGLNTITSNADGNGSYFKEPTTFRLLWLSMDIRQTILLPDAYANVRLKQFGFDSQQGNVLTTDLTYLNQRLGDSNLNSNGLTIYFGMTDSTYFSNAPMMGSPAMKHIRSANYREWVMNPPPPEGTKTYVSTIGFSNDNIIHLYAGADNEPYTEDDAVVLEPNFWDRIYVNVKEE